MAVTAEQLRNALRLGETEAEGELAERLRDVAVAIITQHAPVDAPDVVVDEAAIRIAGYLYDQPLVSRGAAYANAYKNSGAASLIRPYIPLRAVSDDAA